METATIAALVIAAFFLGGGFAYRAKTEGLEDLESRVERLEELCERAEGNE